MNAKARAYALPPKAAALAKMHAKAKVGSTPPKPIVKLKVAPKSLAWTALDSSAGAGWGAALVERHGGSLPTDALHSGCVPATLALTLAELAFGKYGGRCGARWRLAGCKRNDQRRSPSATHAGSYLARRARRY